MTVHNLEGVKQLEKLGFKRVVLSRELSIDEIKYIRENTNIELEVFIHGALCISYSGECLLSSMIGNRSGNRGNCAQPCRLKYDLIEENLKNETCKTIESGHLMSPRDNMGIYYLPELIKSGIDSLKIEGRMKSPIYVGTVTKIYRKYIDLVYQNINFDNDKIREIIKDELHKKNKNTNLSDFEELLQVFNRGGFETGHFNPNGNPNLIYKEKPNNMGIYLGKVLNINQNKGYITTNLKNNVSILDKIVINNNIYNITELMMHNNNLKEAFYGDTVTLGRMKGNINNNDNIYIIKSNKLSKEILESFKDNANIVKIKINGEIIIKKNAPISLKIWSDEGFYNGLEYMATSTNYPMQAQNTPITKEQVSKQLLKTGNTEFVFNNLDVILDNDLFVPNSILNDIRRTALIGLENLILKTYTHNLSYRGIKAPIIKNRENSNKSITILLNSIKTNYNYSNLGNIDRIYIPLKYFLLQEYKKAIQKITLNYKTYIYFPIIMKDNYLNNLNIESTLKKFKIKGFVISHISQIDIISKYGLEIVGNYSLNIFNNYAVEFLQSQGITNLTLSPELKGFEFNDFSNQDVIIYGKIPVMTNQYCYLGKSTKCYSSCSKKCMNSNNYYLQDRMKCRYRIIPDNKSTITTIYNYKPINLDKSQINSNNFRFDILDEPIEEIKKRNKDFLKTKF